MIEAMKQQLRLTRLSLLLAMIAIIGLALLYQQAVAVEPDPELAAGWVKNPYNPVLQPSLDWEEAAVLEPSVLYEDGRFRMWYSAGNTHCAIGYAESSDGYHWQKHGDPVLPDACRSNVIRVEDTLYMTFTRFTPDAHDNVWLATSADGVTWIVAPEPILTTDAQFTSHANTALTTDGATWTLYYESLTEALHWIIGKTESDTPYHFANATAPETLLQRAPDGSYGGASLLGDTLYYHASPNAGVLPTEIYRFHAGVVDLLLPMTQGWFEVDQTADPYALSVNGETWLYYSGCDNRNLAAVACAIGVAHAQ